MKVLIASVSSRALAHSAAAAGYKVTSLDFFGDSDQAEGVTAYSLVRDFGRPPELSALAEVARELAGQAEVVVIGAGLENEPALLELDGPAEHWYNQPQAVRVARDLRRVWAALQGSRVRVPEFRLKSDPLPVGGRWLVKDQRHSGGVGVWDWDGASPLEAAQLLELFVDGQLASASFVADGQRAVLLGLTRQFAGLAELNARPYAWCGNLAPFGDTALHAALQGAADRLTRAFGLVGVNGIDFILDPDNQPVFLEVNPRPGGSSELFERLLGINLFALHGAGCRNRLPEALPAPVTGVYWGKGILYASREVRVGDTRGWAARDIADVPHPGEVIPAGAPVVSLFASGADPEGCWQRVLAQARGLMTELEAERKII